MGEWTIKYASCDRCGKQVVIDNSSGHLGDMHDPRNGWVCIQTAVRKQEKLSNFSNEVELCWNCFEEFKEFLELKTIEKV